MMYSRAQDLTGAGTLVPPRGTHCAATPFRSLQLEILHLSRLTEKEIVDAALEIQIDLEMCREELCLRNPKVAYDPYEEFIAFTMDPGIDFSDVEGSSLDELSDYQIFLAAAWCFVDIADCLEESEPWAANSYEFAARQLVLQVLGGSNSRH